MSRIALLVLMTIGASAISPAPQACGDKFLMVGRGARFQRAYASVYPGKVLIYARPSSDSKAAILDPQLHKALRQAGHSVSVIEDWTLLEQALKTVPVDLILVDVREAARLQSAISSAPTHPAALFVAFPGDPPPVGVTCKLKSSDRPLRYLDEVENAMKTKKGQTKKS
jgi:hypothetical protein